MHIKRLVLSVTIITFTIGLAACAGIPAKVISSFPPGGTPISSIEIVLDKPTFIPTGDAMIALNSEGWSTGELERKFCSGFVERLREAHIDAHCARSLWGRRIFNNEQPQSSSHVLSIKPINLGYLVSYRYGVKMPGAGNPSMETITTITDKQTGAQVWSGIIHVGFAPVDHSGSRRYAQSLLDELRSEKAIRD